MQLKKALQVQLDYNGVLNGIYIDEDGFFNLTEMCTFFPHKRVDNWVRNESTKEFIKIIENLLNPELDEDLNTSNVRMKFIPAMRAKRGRHHGGVYAHKYVAMEFAMWLSPEFKLEVMQAYENGIERKEQYDLGRVLAANGYKLLTGTVSDVIVPEFEKQGKNVRYAFTEEADLINLIVFRKTASEAGGKNQREDATPDELDMILYLQQIDSGLIEAGLSYQDRFDKLTELYDRRRIKLLS